MICETWNFKMSSYIRATLSRFTFTFRFSFSVDEDMKAWDPRITVSVMCLVSELLLDTSPLVFHPSDSSATYSPCLSVFAKLFLSDFVLKVKQAQLAGVCGAADLGYPTSECLVLDRGKVGAKKTNNHDKRRTESARPRIMCLTSCGPACNEDVRIIVVSPRVT